MPYQNRRKKLVAFDEYYTPYEQVELLLGELRDSGQFANIKSICCPCDGEHSNIVKWLKANTNAKIVYFDYLDCNSAKARQQMLKCGCVITNPPFSSSEWSPLIKFLIDSNLKYFIWGPYLQNGHFRSINRLDRTKDYALPFERPNGAFMRVHFAVYTNLAIAKLDYDYVPAIKAQYYQGIPVYDSFKNVPKDYYGWMYVPQSAIGFLGEVDYDKARSIIGVPGKYVRLCVRRKHKHG